MNAKVSSVIERLKNGESVVNKEGGNSMTPKIKHRQPVTISPVDTSKLEKGDIVYVKVKGNVYTHMVYALRDGEVQIGNNHGHVNGWTSIDNVYGIVTIIGSTPVGGVEPKIKS